MKHSPEILAELTGISPVLAEIPKRNIFSVPNNYFQNFSKTVFSKIEDGYSLPAKEIITQKVPEGYFENLTDTILLKIKEAELQTAGEEMETLSTVIAGIGNKNIFKVPIGYFEKPLWTAETKTEPAKVVTVNFRKRILQLAVAAAVALLITLTVFNYYTKSNTQIENGLAQEKQTEAVMAQANQIINNNSFDDMLDQLPADEIENYLEQRGLDVQAALVASSIDAKNLPSAEDYLFNENALNDFLKEQNIQN